MTATALYHRRHWNSDNNNHTTNIFSQNDKSEQFLQRITSTMSSNALNVLIAQKAVCINESCEGFRVDWRTTQLICSSYTIFECLFIFSVSKLLLNAASYDGEIWHADAWQPRSGLLLVFVSTVWVKKIPPRGPDIFSFFHKRLRICNRFLFTHLLNVPIFARLHIIIQLSPILTKLCHIKRDYPVHIICAKCPKRTKTRAFRRLRKSLIALLIVVCGK